MRSDWWNYKHHMSALYFRIYTNAIYELETKLHAREKRKENLLIQVGGVVAEEFDSYYRGHRRRRRTYERFVHVIPCRRYHRYYFTFKNLIIRRRI